MAIRGRKPKNPTLRLVTGGRAGDPPMPDFRKLPPDISPGRPEIARHKYLSRPAVAIWHAMLPTLPWLRTADGYLFATWCDQEARYEQGGREAWSVAMLAEHRRCGDALGLGQGYRNRLTEVESKVDAGEDYFGG